MKLQDITQLLTLFEQYTQQHPKTNWKDFGYWLIEQQNIEVVDESQLNRDLGYYINRINRYSRYYSKQFLEHVIINSLDEFTFLTAIKILGTPSKSAVYDFTITELTTGQQMMRRLVKMGLVQEEQDLDDKRVKRVSLTLEGLATQEAAFEAIGKECNLKFGQLDHQSKHQLLDILKRLDQINQTIYQS